MLLLYLTITALFALNVFALTCTPSENTIGKALSPFNDNFILSTLLMVGVKIINPISLPKLLVKGVGIPFILILYWEEVLVAKKDALSVCLGLNGYIGSYPVLVKTCIIIFFAIFTILSI